MAPPSQQKPSSILEVSAGGVVHRRDEQGHIEVVLIATHHGTRWGLPKGWIEPGEPVEAAAVREVREETGLSARIVAPVDTIEYWFRWVRGGKPVRIHKRVHFFLMEAGDGDLGDHDQEVDEARWVPLDEAIGQVTYDGERRVLEQAREKLVPDRVL